MDATAEDTAERGESGTLGDEVCYSLEEVEASAYWAFVIQTTSVTIKGMFIFFLIQEEHQ